jgi:5'-methylthioadenosine phosphorylase
VAVAIITGSGTHSLPGFVDPHAESVATPYGEVEVVRGGFAGEPVLHVSRHGDGHARLSNLVTHRANIWALGELGADAVIGCTACGGVDPALELGSLVVFDDLWYLSNRLPDGSLCTFFDRPGDPQRGHWILAGGPFSEELRGMVVLGATAAGVPVRDGGVYGHVDGPRFNTPTEIAALGRAGVTAVSQTGGPETVLCGELELPFALLGFVTDHANEVIPGATTPIEELGRLMAASREVFAAALAEAIRQLATGGRLGALTPGGAMFRLERG